MVKMKGQSPWDEVESPEALLKRKTPWSRQEPLMARHDYQSLNPSASFKVEPWTHAWNSLLSIVFRSKGLWGSLEE